MTEDLDVLIKNVAIARSVERDARAELKEAQDKHVEAREKLTYADAEMRKEVRRLVDLINPPQYGDPIV